MKNSKLNQMIKISLLSVIAFALMYLDFAIPVFPAFLKIDLSDLPALIGAFALGPVSGVIIEFLKNILILIFKGTQTAFVGELANFVVGALLVFTAGAVYRTQKTRKTAAAGLVLGVVVMSAIACILNYYVMIPLYAKLFGGIDAIIQWSAAANSRITGLGALILWGILPFNLLKGFVVSVVTMLIYKRVSPLLHQETLANDFNIKKVS